jgi:hypothetical protein
MNPMFAVHVKLKDYSVISEVQKEHSWDTIYTLEHYSTYDVTMLVNASHPFLARVVNRRGWRWRGKRNERLDFGIKQLFIISISLVLLINSSVNWNCYK